MDISETLKKGFLAGLGVFAVKKEEAEAILDRLVEKGRMSAEEAESIAREFAKQGKEQIKSFDLVLSEFAKNIYEKAPFLRKDALAGLEKRVEKLEKEVRKLRRTPLKRKYGI